MPSLGKTVAALRRFRRHSGESPIREKGVFAETRAFGANPGSLRMLSYTPDGLAPGAALVVVLHGCGQSAEAHAVAAGWKTLADRFGFALLAPEQSARNNPNRCFNWFEPQHAARDAGEAASIRAMVAHAVKAHRLDAGRIYVTGLSAGGAMTSVALAAYPDVFAGGAIVAGLPYGVADNLPGALGAMQGGRTRSAAELGELVRKAAPADATMPRVSIWHGDADVTVNASNAAEIAKQWAAAHGLAPAPSEAKSVEGRTRLVWRDRRTGEALVESNIVHGLGHGTPLSTLGTDPLGAVAPFMLEAGVSAALEIARFWGLAPAAAPGAEVDRISEPPRQVLAGEVLGPEQPAPSLGETVMASVVGRVDPGVEGVISAALKSAGLLK